MKDMEQLSKEIIRLQAFQKVELQENKILHVRKEFCDIKKSE